MPQPLPTVNRTSDLSRIKRITESIINLPTLPTVVSRMIELVDNPKTSAESLSRLISTDQALTAKILKIANSAYYGFPREISTVNMAIVVLGFNAVKDMGLSISVFEVFKGTSADDLFDMERFWEHSIGCAVAAKMVARHYYNRFAAEAFVAGLLHDIGKAIIYQYLHPQFLSILQRISSGEELADAETTVLGAGHGQIGAWLAEKWNLPKPISDAIKNHHEPWNAQHDAVLVAIVSLADLICHRSNMSGTRLINPLPLDPRLFELLHSTNVLIEESELDNLQTEFLMEFDKADSMMSFVKDDSNARF